jgi:hypothetical protein
MQQNLSKDIIQSIQAAGFKEEVCSSLEALHQSNQPLAASTLEKIIEFERQTTLDTPQITTAMRYSSRFLQIFGYESIAPLYPYILRHADTKDLELIQVMKDLVLKLITVDATIRDTVFKQYFRYSLEIDNQQTHSNEVGLKIDNPNLLLQILLGYAESHTKVSSSNINLIMN